LKYNQSLDWFFREKPKSFSPRQISIFLKWSDSLISHQSRLGRKGLFRRYLNVTVQIQKTRGMGRAAPVGADAGRQFPTEGFIPAGTAH
jgi:hypothetical protein